MRTDLIAWDSGRGRPLELANAAIGLPSGEGSFKLEGSSWRRRARRPPTSASARRSAAAEALIVPVTNFDKLLAGTAAHGSFGEPIWLDLGGRGIRELRKNVSDEYLIVAGGSGAGTVGGGQVLYSWDGVAGHAPALLEQRTPTRRDHALRRRSDGVGGLAAVPHPLAGGTVTLVGDQGESILYGPGDTTANNLAATNLRKAPIQRMQLGDPVEAPVGTATTPVFPAQAAGTTGRGQ